MRLLLPLILLACSFDASTKVVDDSGTGATSDTGVETDTGDTGTVDPGDLHPSDIDDDGDGVTENEGDCDDADETVHPGVTDECDGVDSDCDGTIDDDAVDADLYEPNDTEDFDIGQLETDDVFEANAFLHDGADADRFSFTFDDRTWEYHTLEVDLEWDSGDVLYVMTIENIDTGEVLYNAFSTSGERTLHYEEDDSLGSEDGGRFRVTISSDGSATCLVGYQLTVSLSGLI